MTTEEFISSRLAVEEKGKEGLQAEENATRQKS